MFSRLRAHGEKRLVEARDTEKSFYYTDAFQQISCMNAFGEFRDSHIYNPPDRYDSSRESLLINARLATSSASQ